MPIIILAVLVIAAWIDLGRRLHRLTRHIMSTADDLNAKLDSIKDSVTNLSEDVIALKDLVANAPGPDGSIAPADAQAILAKATALADQAAAAAGLFPSTPPA
jgi:hypothetical protein